MNITYLLLGSNEGDRISWLRKGKEQIELYCGASNIVSSIYQTAAWGLEEQPDFLNQVICIQTFLKPGELLLCIQQIENNLGRQRTVKWGQRTLDIDILLYDNAVINSPDLNIPHPFLEKRRFTLAPLCEIAPNLVHPQLNKTMRQLLEDCPDTLPVRKLNTEA